MGLMFNKGNQIIFIFLSILLSVGFSSCSKEEPEPVVKTKKVTKGTVLFSTDIGTFDVRVIVDGVNMGLITKDSPPVSCGGRNLSGLELQLKLGQHTFSAYAIGTGSVKIEWSGGIHVRKDCQVINLTL